MFGSTGRGALLLFLLAAGCGGDRLGVQSVWPGPDEQGVPLDARVEVAFDAPVRLASRGEGLRLTLDGAAVEGALSVEEGGGPLVFTPTHFLLADRRYEVELTPEAAETLADKRIGKTHSWAFTTVAGCDFVPGPAGLQQTGPTPDGAFLIPGGRRLSPRGTLVEAGSFPMNLLAWPGQPLLVVTNNGEGLGSGKAQSIQLFDAQTGELLQTIDRDRPGAFYYGLAVSGDGRQLYAAGGGADRVEIFELQPGDRSLAQAGQIPVEGFAAGLLLDEPRGLLYVGAQVAGDVEAIELATGERRWRKHMGVLPYDLVLSADRTKLYVSLWGRANLGNPGQVAVVDPDTGSLLTKIDTGKNPQDMALASDGRLFVACSDADRVDVIDTRTDTLTASWSLLADPGAAVGLSPVALALDEARDRLYVACAQKNSLDVLDLRSGAALGSLPTAWYPTGVARRPSDDGLLLTAGKGVGSGPKPQNGDINRYFRGSLSLIDLPSDADLAAGAQEVHDNNTYPLRFFPDRCLGRAFPLPRAIGQPSPIKHVIFVLRENKTYDQNLGDLEGTDGDPSLVMFGEELTPNLHALAREFCNLENFYAEIEVSVQGHYWNVAGTINDYSERAWHASYRDDSRLPSTGTQQPDYPAGKFIWHKLHETGIPFRNYSEPVGLLGDIDMFEDSVNQDVMLDLGLNLYSTPDAQRVEWFLEEVEAGIYPAFVFLGLLNDHTYGRTPGQPTPQWMVAENDYATGLLVDRISHSEHWADTLIIITEDDPQSGADHVDGHRSIALLISPHTRRGYTSSVNYGFSSLIRTYGLILGMPALNVLDETASPVYDCFTSQPDFTAYDVREMNIGYEENNYGMPGAWESEQMDFSEVDRADGLGRVLWMATHPDEPLPPQIEAEGPWELEEEEERWVLPVPLERLPSRKDMPWSRATQR